MSSPDTTPPSPDIVDRLTLMLERQVLAPDVVDDARREIERLRGELVRSDDPLAQAPSDAATARMVEGWIALIAHQETLKVVGTPPDQRDRRYLLAYTREVHAQMVVGAEAGIVTDHMIDTIRRSADRELATAGWADTGIDAHSIRVALERLSGR